MDLRAIARTLGGEVSSGQILAPGPGHSRTDRSLSIRLSASAPDGFLVFSHSGDDAMACKDHVRRLLGINRDAPAPRAAVPRARTAGPPADEATKIHRAAALWAEGVDPRGTIVEKYLRSRQLDLPEESAGVALRFHPACPWQEAPDKIIRVPAMLAAMRNIRSDELTGVHRTRLTADGQKVDRRMLGIAAEAAIKLDANDAVTMGLTIGEGIETVLAGRQIGFRPAWALGSVGAISNFLVLAGIDALTILAEADANGASDRAVNTAAARWYDAGREVIVVAPKRGNDVNDAIREE